MHILYMGSLARIPLGAAQTSDAARGDPWLPVDARGEYSNVSRMINYQHRDHLCPPWGALRLPLASYQPRGARG